MRSSYELAAADPRIALLRTIPELGTTVRSDCTMFDDVTRFRTAGQVGSYIGMVPKSFDSGETTRSAASRDHGNRLVRSCLLRLPGLALRHNPWARRLFNASVRQEIAA